MTLVGDKLRGQSMIQLMGDERILFHKRGRSSPPQKQNGTKGGSKLHDVLKNVMLVQYDYLDN